MNARIVVMSILLLCQAPSHSQTTNETRAPTSHAENATSVQSPSPSGSVRISTPVTPLNIEQIRANLPTTAAEKFEFLRNQRKTTLDAIANTATSLATVESKMTTLRAASE